MTALLWKSKSEINLLSGKELCQAASFPGVKSRKLTAITVLWTVTTSRRRLQSMAPKRAIAYVMSVQLPPDEAVCVIECDVKRKSYCETAFLLNVSPETVKRCRRRAYQKFADEERSRTI